MKYVLTRVGLVFFSVVTVLVVGEGILRVVPVRTPQSPVAAQSDTLIHCVPDSVLGWLLPADAQGTFQTGRYLIPISANGWGLRNPSVDAADLSVFRILVLGDSYAFGWGVWEEETFPRQLESMFRDRYPDRNIAVINAGIPGYGIYQQRRMLNLLLKQVRIDVVISTLSLANDPVDDLRISRFLPDNLLDYSGHLKDPTGMLAKIISGSRLLSFLDKRTLPIQFFAANLSPPALRLTQENIASLADSCAMNDLDLLLVVVPRRSEVTSRTGWRSSLIHQFMRRERRVVQVVEDAYRITVVDLTDTLVEVEDEEGAYLADDVHWTPVAHTSVAAAILEAFPDEWLRD